MDKKIIKSDDTEMKNTNSINVKALFIKWQYLIRFLSAKNLFKYFIGHKDAKEIRPLCIFLPNICAYRRDLEKTKCMPFLIKDEKSLEQYNETWEKVSNSIKKIFNSKPAYHKKYLKTEAKSYEGKINTNEGSQYIFMSAILVDSVYRNDKNYYPQVFLEKYKYVVKKKSMSKFIIEDI